MLPRENILRNRVQAINVLHQFIRRSIPKIEAYIAENGINIKQDGSLYKKDKEALNEITKVYDGSPIMAFFKTSCGNLVLETDTHYTIDIYKDGGRGVAYYKRSHYFGADFAPASDGYADLDIKEVLKLDAKRPEIEAKIRELKSELSDINWICGG